MVRRFFLAGMPGIPRKFGVSFPDPSLSFPNPFSESLSAIVPSCLLIIVLAANIIL